MQTRQFLLSMSLGTVLALPAISNAQIYVGHAADGSAVLSDFANAQAPEVIVAAPKRPQPGQAPLPSSTSQDVAAPSAFRKMIEEVATGCRLDPKLLYAMIEVESGHNPVAVSTKGARGLMQIMPATARRFGATDLFDPRENVRAGARYLSWLIGFFGGNIELALAGYNAGEQAVIQAGYRIPPYAETRSYVSAVLSRYRKPAAE